MGIFEGRVVVTGKAGPAETVTAIPINDCRSVELDFEKGILTVKALTGEVKQIDVNGLSSITTAVAGKVLTITVA